jgi:hypothetical protein
MGTRILLTLLAKVATPGVLRLMGLIALIPAIGFTVIYAMDLRKTGPEVFGDCIWWNDLRPVHAALWGAFAVLALARIPAAWILLALDTALGFLAFALMRRENV